MPGLLDRRLRMWLDGYWVAAEKLTKVQLIIELLGRENFSLTSQGPPTISLSLPTTPNVLFFLWLTTTTTYTILQILCYQDNKKIWFLLLELAFFFFLCARYFDTIKLISILSTTFLIHGFWFMFQSDLIIFSVFPWSNIYPAYSWYNTNV